MPPGRSGELAGIIDLLVEIAHCVKPLDHVPGRITMGVSLFNLPKVLSLIVNVGVDEDASSIPGIKGYEVSAWRMSATILYDPDVLPFELWSDFCSIRDSPDAEKSFRDRIVSLIENNSAGSVA